MKKDKITLGLDLIVKGICYTIISPILIIAWLVGAIALFFCGTPHDSGAS